MKELNHILLEYNPKQAKTGGFHYNVIQNNKPQSPPESYGWETIANTFETKANVFGDIIEGENDRRIRDGKKPLTTKEVRLKWMEYSYIYNSILTRKIDEEYVELAKKFFKSAITLARLGNGHFTDLQEAYDTDYDPMSFIEANF